MKIGKSNMSMTEEYWDIQLEEMEKSNRKPIWRDYLETQRKLMDDLHSHAWTEIMVKQKKDGKE